MATILEVFSKLSLKDAPKKVELLEWQQFGSLHYKVYSPESAFSFSDEIVNVNIFDMDDTLITPKEGRFPKDRFDWKWYDESIPQKLKEIKGVFCMMSNQRGIANGKATVSDIQGKMDDMILSLNLDSPAICMFAADYGVFAKPFMGMYCFLKDRIFVDLGLANVDPYYVGDAAGREALKEKKKVLKKKDHSMADVYFAINCGIRFYTPEAYFGIPLVKRTLTNIQPSSIGQVPQTKEEKEQFPNMVEVYGVSYKDLLKATTPSHQLLSSRPSVYGRIENLISECGNLVVLLVGAPASGKSYLARQLNHKFKCSTVINQDKLGSKKKVLAEIEAWKSNRTDLLIIDRTHPDSNSRHEVTESLKEFTTIALFLETPKERSFRNNEFRAGLSTKESRKGGRVEKIVIHTFYKNCKKPDVKEGFKEVIVTTEPHATDEEIDTLFKNMLVC